MIQSSVTRWVIASSNHVTYVGVYMKDNTSIKHINKLLDYLNEINRLFMFAIHRVESGNLDCVPSDEVILTDSTIISDYVFDLDIDYSFDDVDEIIRTVNYINSDQYDKISIELLHNMRKNVCDLVIATKMKSKELGK